MSKLHPLKAVAITLALVTGPAALAELYVVPTSDYPTIQSAIEACNQNGDEVSVVAGAYFEQINFLGKSVHVYSQSGAIATFIDGQGTSGPLVTFHTAENENAILEGFTVRNAPNGAGISCNGSAPSILSCKIIGNSSANGGGVASVDSDLVFVDCEIKNNFATNGAGMHFTGGTLTMSNSLIRGNVVNQNGGGIWCSGTAMGVDSCTFEDNHTSAMEDTKGGAIYMSDSSLSIVDCNFTNNETYTYVNVGSNAPDLAADGGAIYSNNSTATVTECTFTNNRCYAYLQNYDDSGDDDEQSIVIATGGDLHLANFSNWQVTNCMFNGSGVATYGLGNGGSSGDGSDYVAPLAQGGSIYITGAAIQLTNCELTASTSSVTADGYNWGDPAGNGGAIYSDTNGNPFMQNCSITGCSADNGGAIYTYGSASPFMLNGHLTANTASGNGGAIYSENSFPVITGAVINNNTASAGGGIYSQGSAPSLPTVSNTLFCANSTDHITGGWYDDGDVTFSDTCGDDCNENGVPDEYDLIWGYSLDCNANGVPDECDIAKGGDCDGNSIPDECDIADGTYEDCDGNGVPDVCEMPTGDCNKNGILDACESITDCNTNGIPDECDIAEGSSVDCDANGIPDECEPDCNTNGVTDACDIANGTSTDCDNNGVPDECDPYFDCNDNGANDTCDIANGDSQDGNGNGIPDECECPADVNGDGFINVNDLLAVVSAWGSTTDSAADVNGNGIVDVSDILIVIAQWGDPCP